MSAQATASGDMAQEATSCHQPQHRSDAQGHDSRRSRDRSEHRTTGRRDESRPRRIRTVYRYHYPPATESESVSSWSSLSSSSSDDYPRRHSGRRSGRHSGRHYSGRHYSDRHYSDRHHRRHRHYGRSNHHHRRHGSRHGSRYESRHGSRHGGHRRSRRDDPDHQVGTSRDQPQGKVNDPIDDKSQRKECETIDDKPKGKENELIAYKPKGKERQAIGDKPDQGSSPGQSPIVAQKHVTAVTKPSSRDSSVDGGARICQDAKPSTKDTGKDIGKDAGKDAGKGTGATTKVAVGPEDAVPATPAAPVIIRPKFDPHAYSGKKPVTTTTTMAPQDRKAWHQLGTQKAPIPRAGEMQKPSASLVHPSSSGAVVPPKVSTQGTQGAQVQKPSAGNRDQSVKSGRRGRRGRSNKMKDPTNHHRQGLDSNQAQPAASFGGQGGRGNQRLGKVGQPMPWSTQVFGNAALQRWASEVSPAAVHNDLAGFTKQVADHPDCGVDPKMGLLQAPVVSSPVLTSSDRRRLSLVNKPTNGEEPNNMQVALRASPPSSVSYPDINSDGSHRNNLVQSLARDWDMPGMDFVGGPMGTRANHEPLIASHMRPASPEDMAEVLEIYNAEVKDGGQAFDSQPLESEAFKRTLTQSIRDSLVFIVAVAGSAHDLRDVNTRSSQPSNTPKKGRILGFAYLQPYHRGMCGAVMNSTGVKSVKLVAYVHRKYRGNLIGYALLDKMMQITCADYDYQDTCEFFDEKNYPIFKGPKEGRQYRAIYAEVLRNGKGDQAMRRYDSLLVKYLGFDKIGVLERSHVVGGEERDLVTYRRVCHPETSVKEGGH